MTGLVTGLVACVILFIYLVNKKNDDDDSDGPTAWAVA